MFEAKLPSSEVVTVAFFPSMVDVNVLNEEMREHLSRSTPPNSVVLLGTVGCKPLFVDILEGGLLEGLPAITGLGRLPRICGLCLNREGDMEPPTNATPMEMLSPGGILRSLTLTGLRKIFFGRNAVLDGGGSHHYELSSAKHASTFIRTANILTASAETSFIAFTLASQTRWNDFKHIYIDTGAIAPVAYAYLRLIAEVSQRYPSCTIESFGSHIGVDRFQFDALPSSLVLISASTSNSLAPKLMERGAKPENTVTLYYVGHALPTTPTLCDVTQRADFPGGLPPIAIYPRESCYLCHNGQHYIPILGDHFLPESPRITTIEILATDAPQNLRRFCDEFCGKSVIQVHRRPRHSNRTLELFLDLNPILDAPFSGQGERDRSFVSQLDRLIVQTVPAALSNVVYVDTSESSVLLARRITQHFQSTGRASPQLIASSELCKSPKSYSTKSGAVLVVGGTAMSGRSLIDVSQSLRDMQLNGAIQYLIAVTRTKDSALLEQIKQNIQRGRKGADYGFNCVESIFLPDNLSTHPSPWDEEIRLLRALLRKYSADVEFAKTASARIRRIETAEVAGGLHDALFWPRVDDRPLQLRGGFALWDFSYSTRAITQAEVYFTICATLHSLRIGGPNRRATLHSDHHRVLISPGQFDRYSDGIIQACFLRASESTEMDYRPVEHLSKEMSNVLHHRFEHMYDDAGEATVEYLLALAARHVRLRPRHAIAALEPLLDSSSLPTIVRTLRDFVCDQAESEIRGG